MKKHLSIFIAAAAIVFGAASCMETIRTADSAPDAGFELSENRMRFSVPPVSGTAPSPSAWFQFSNRL